MPEQQQSESSPQKTATVYFLCGLPASGKTTIAKQIEAEQGAIRFTLDERMIAKYDYSIFDEAYGRLANEEKQILWREARQYLDQGQDVILDWSLWNRQARAEWTQKAVAAGYDYRLIYLNVPLELLRRRLARRNANLPAAAHAIPLEELERFSPIFEPPSSAENLNLDVVTPKETV